MERFATDFNVVKHSNLEYPLDYFSLTFIWNQITDSSDALLGNAKLCGFFRPFTEYLDSIRVVPFWMSPVAADDDVLAQREVCFVPIAVESASVILQKFLCV